MQIERILREYGHFLRPMSEAPRDGQRILGYSARGGHLMSCYWELRPQGLIGPNWVEERDSSIGYVDRYFGGWISPGEFRLLDSNAINRLLVAYIDDARAADDREALRMLEAGEGVDVGPAAFGQQADGGETSFIADRRRTP